MAHRLLTYPVNRMEGRVRLPMLQDIGGATGRRFMGSLMPRDSLRRINTSRSLISTAPLAPLQKFVTAGPGNPNTPESMSSGLMIGNAARINKTHRTNIGA
jgi:hypothetical protein